MSCARRRYGCAVTDVRVEPSGKMSTVACPKCGGTSHRIHGYVYADEAANGVYFLDWCEGRHGPRIAWLTLSLGTWGEGIEGAHRSAFGIEWRDAGMALLDSPLIGDQPDLLGEFVPREQALALDDIDHLWHVTDHLVTDDPRFFDVQQWLAGSGRKRGKLRRRP